MSLVAELIGTCLKLQLIAGVANSSCKFNYQLGLVGVVFLDPSIANPGRAPSCQLVT